MTDTVATLAVEPRLNRRQAAKIRTRQKVLDAARSLFAERGYEPATIRDIAKGAGMSTGAVFANFPDKAELFEAVLTEDMTRLAEVVEAAAPAGEPVRQRLLSALTAGYQSSLEHLPLFQAIVARSWLQPLAAEMRARAATKNLLLAIGGILQDAVAKNELSKDADIRLLVELIWDAYLSNYRRAAYDEWDAQALSDHMGKQIDVILAGALAAK
jgi:AcrR family transcriptional regulator